VSAEPTPQDPWPDEIDLPVLTLEEQKARDWRLLCLLRVYREHVPSVDERETQALVLLAESNADLRAMERALGNGCSLANALRIFL
jgi:hypothetical protein